MTESIWIMHVMRGKLPLQNPARQSDDSRAFLFQASRAFKLMAHVRG